METICDKCGDAIEEGYENEAPPGEWEGSTLCNECYAEIEEL